MRTVMPAAEVAHVWANRGQDNARTSSHNCSFNRDVLRSYSATIARHVTGTRKRTAVVITTIPYSMTTRRHVSEAESAARHLTRFHVPLTGDSRDTPAVWFQSYADRVRETLERASRARTNKAWLLGEAQRLAAEGDRLAEFVGLRKRINLPADLDAALAAARAAKEAADRKNAAAIAERRKRDEAERERVRQLALAAVDDWRARRINHIPHVSTLPADLMRVIDNGRTVQTSRGATVPADHVRRAVRLLTRLHERGQDYVANGHSLRVGHYTVSRFVAGMVQVGCHSFQWSEVQAIAEQLSAPRRPCKADRLTDDVRDRLALRVYRRAVRQLGRDAALFGPSDARFTMPKLARRWDRLYPSAVTIGDIPSELALLTGDDTAPIRALLGETADGFDSFYVGTADGEYTAVYGFVGTVPANSRAAVRLFSRGTTPVGPPCPGCGGTGIMAGERCFGCQGAGVVASNEGGAL